MLEGKPQKIIIDLDQHNYLSIQDQSYFIFEIEPHLYVLLQAICPHRGGPLHLGTCVQKNDRDFIRCPWHDNQFSIERLIEHKFSLTLVSERYLALSVDANIDLSEITLSKKPILLKPQRKTLCPI